MDTKALRQKILDLAIRGKLVPQDPNDEPASVLLERIRAEKQQMVKDGKLKPKDIKNDTVIFKGDDNLHYEKFSDGSVKCIEDEIPFELPEGWEWSRLTAICSLISDIDHKMPKAVDDGVLFLSAKDLLNDGTINYTNGVKMISEEDFLRLSRKALPQKNDIIYSRIGACLGKARVVTKEIRFLVSYSCCTIRPLIIDSIFLASILDGNFVLDQAKKGTQSVGVPDLGMASIKQFLIPIPPLVEQQRIDERLQSAFHIVQQISNGYDNLNLAIMQVKSKILDLAIRGKLVSQDPNDEPASVLLERIRAEKEELIKQGKIKRDKKESVIFKGDDNSYYEKYGEKLPSGWVVTNFETLLSYEQPTNYIVKDTNYKSKYETPVLTAGKSFILGYTDEKENIFSELPVIIFDDFTTESKFVDFPFKVKSSAMKILHINTDLVLPKFAFYLMQATQIDHDNHQRYWISTYSQEEIALPPLKEQERILSALEQYFKLLNCLL
jgi:type I restriction enzyme S subunit